ncbi:hypothetical protein RCL_jg13042.t1 [Rhizophagus clarus]|uniref:Protein kinase domain-containing protein n=1 Tax=Rhizophagus clarus TaxID=94130 RepID=A0A8H3QFD5_9GLOM|nr:hypothetical protein RCL_jg13042.t1 [Rhizophagus clarus]
MSNVTEYNLSNLPTADVVKVWSKDDVKKFLQRNRTDLELEENDVNVIYDQNVTGKAFLRLKEEQLTRDPGPFKLLFGPASAIAEVVKQISGDQPAKRRYDEMQIDRTATICDALIQPFDTVPSQAGDLMSLIHMPLTRKLPVSFYEEIKFPQLADFIETKNDECGSDLSKHISHILTDIVQKQSLNNTSEDMLHYGVDSMIRVPLQIFHENLGGGVLPIEMDRNSKDQGTTTIGNKRPDFLCWTNNVLLFKGEEKAEIGNFSEAVDELEGKFDKFDPMYFGDIQFMIYYAVAGPRLRFYAIDGSPNTNPPSRLVALSNQLDMSNRRDRVSILCVVVNIARIMRTVSNTIPEMIVPLGKRLKTEKSIITILTDSVEKRVSVEYLPFAGNVSDRIDFLSNMYEYARGHPGLVQIKEGPKISRQGIYKIVLESRGHVCRLRNEDDARAMSQSVLTGLTWLHKGGYVHRDIRLPNILFVPGVANYKYVLIDFEHANVGGLVVSEQLKVWDIKTLTKGNKYTSQSDMYQFGKMLENLNIINSDDGKRFLNSLKNKNINSANALKHAWFK